MTNTLDTVQSELDGMTAATAEHEAREAITASHQADQDARVFLAYAAHTVADAVEVKGVSARSIAKGLDKACGNKDTVARLVRVGHILRLDTDDEILLDDGQAAVAARYAVNAAVRSGAGLRAIDATVKAAANREEAIAQVGKLRPVEDEPVEEPVEPEQGASEDEQDDQEHTAWEDRLAALVVQSLLEGATADEVRTVVEMALAA